MDATKTMLGAQSIAIIPGRDLVKLLTTAAEKAGGWGTLMAAMDAMGYFIVPQCIDAHVDSKSAGAFATLLKFTLTCQMAAPITSDGKQLRKLARYFLGAPTNVTVSDAWRSTQFVCALQASIYPPIFVLTLLKSFLRGMWNNNDTPVCKLVVQAVQFVSTGSNLIKLDALLGLLARVFPRNLPLEILALIDVGCSAGWPPEAEGYVNGCTMLTGATPSGAGAEAALAVNVVPHFTLNFVGLQKLLDQNEVEAFLMVMLARLIEREQRIKSAALAELEASSVSLPAQVQKRGRGRPRRSSGQAVVTNLANVGGKIQKVALHGRPVTSPPAIGRGGVRRLSAKAAAALDQDAMEEAREDAEAEREVEELPVAASSTRIP